MEAHNDEVEYLKLQIKYKTNGKFNLIRIRYASLFFLFIKQYFRSGPSTFEE